MRFFATPPIDGAFAEYVTVHESFAHVVPSNISDEGAALLEPLSVGVWSCRKGAVGPGSRVLITGAGAIGLISVQCALASGATEVVVSDINPVRLALAKELGATAVIDAGEGGLGELDMAPDVLIECSGHPPAIGEAISKLAPAGRAVLVGMGGDEIRLPLAVVQQREIVVTGTFRYANTWPTAISLVASGRISLDRLVTGRYRLDEAEAALVSSRDDKTAVKAVVYPQK
jgi:L-iditol 2-dehydrogenase